MIQLNMLARRDEEEWVGERMAEGFDMAASFEMWKVRSDAVALNALAKAAVRDESKKTPDAAVFGGVAGASSGLDNGGESTGAGTTKKTRTKNKKKKKQGGTAADGTAAAAARPEDPAKADGDDDGATGDADEPAQGEEEEALKSPPALEPIREEADPFSKPQWTAGIHGTQGFGDLRAEARRRSESAAARIRERMAALGVSSTAAATAVSPAPAANVTPDAQQLPAETHRSDTVTSAQKDDTDAKPTRRRSSGARIASFIRRMSKSSDKDASPPKPESLPGTPTSARASPRTSFHESGGDAASRRPTMPGFEADMAGVPGIPTVPESFFDENDDYHGPGDAAISEAIGELMALTICSGASIKPDVPPPTAGAPDGVMEPTILKSYQEEKKTDHQKQSG